MRLSLDVQRLVIASWKADRESVARLLYPGLEPRTVEGEYLVSVVGLVNAGGRIGRMPVLPFSQLNVRTYVSYRGEPAVYFLRTYVSWAGMGAALFGAPHRPARLRLEEGRAEAPGIGLALRYRLGEPGAPGELGRHELGLFEAAGLRGFRIRRGSAEWVRGTPVEKPRADVLLALGFDVTDEPTLFYTAHTSFETDVPPRKLG